MLGPSFYFGDPVFSNQWGPRTLFFYALARTLVRDSKTVTEEKAYWLLPAGVSGATYREVSDIDFTSAKTKKKLLYI